MARRKLVIFPFNGNGQEALDCLDPDDFDFLGFVDDDRAKHSEQYPIYNRNILSQYEELYVLAVPGSPSSYRMRKEVIASLKTDRFITAIHPSAVLGRSVKVGLNCLIMAGVVLTSNALVGNHVCILPNTVVHHDSVIGDYTLVGSKVAIAGGVTVGNNCYIGSGSNIMNGLMIGEGALVGLGSNVLRNVPAKDRVAGNPAKSLAKPIIHSI